MTKSNYNILLLDDEALSAELLHETILDILTHQKTQSVDVFTSTKLSDFWNLYEQHKPQIIFLDINTPNKNGIEIAQEIREKEISNNCGKSTIVFVTAHEKFAYEAFGVEADGYILKPYDPEEIKKVLEKHIFTPNHNQKIEGVKTTSNGISITIPNDEIMFFKAELKYITLTTEKKDFILSTTILKLEDEHPDFLKVHRSYLVNPKHINRLYKKGSKWVLSVGSADKKLFDIPVSRNLKQNLDGTISYYDIAPDR